MTTIPPNSDITLEEVERLLDKLVLKKEIIYKQAPPIPQDGISNLLDTRVKLFFDESDVLAEKMFTGEISIGQWEEQMKKMIRELNTATTAITKGGWDNVGSRDWGRLGPHLKLQYNKLHGFAQYVTDNKDKVSLKYIRARARLYGEGGLRSAVIVSTPVFIADLLPWLPKDGSTECLNRCRCYWKLDITGKQGRINIVRAVWHLVAEHNCKDCPPRDGHVEILEVPDDVTIPSRIGGY